MSPAWPDKISRTAHISILCIFIRLVRRVVGRNQDVIYELPAATAAIWMQRLWRTTEIAVRNEKGRKDEKIKEQQRVEKKEGHLNAPLFALYDRYLPRCRIITDFNLISREASE